MNEILIEVIGGIAGVCTTISFIPQLIKIVKTRHAKDISLKMYLLLTFGICLWIIYGVLVKKIPIIMANSIAFTLCVIVLILKVRYDRRVQ